MNPLITKKLEEFDEKFIVHYGEMGNNIRLNKDIVGVVEFLTTALEEALLAGKAEGIVEEGIGCYEHCEAARKEGVLAGIELAEGVVPKEETDKRFDDTVIPLEPFEYHQMDGFNRCRTETLSALSSLKAGL